jgi:hypothetical protein
VDAVGNPDVALRVVDCVCCQNAVNILPSNFDQSCGQVEVEGFSLVIPEFDNCARCSDNVGCEKCFVSPDFGNPNATPEIKECIVADQGVTPPNQLPIEEEVTVNDVGTTGTVQSLL